MVECVGLEWVIRPAAGKEILPRGPHASGSGIPRATPEPGRICGALRPADAVPGPRILPQHGFATRRVRRYGCPGGAG